MHSALAFELVWQSLELAPLRTNECPFFDQSDGRARSLHALRKEHPRTEHWVLPSTRCPHSGTFAENAPSSVFDSGSRLVLRLDSHLQLVREGGRRHEVRRREPVLFKIGAFANTINNEEF